ncbi:hypothetical protein EV363DRAFT_1458483 [Boletus edulis]|nr:hypothetical protein EV363DRAFT_1458483 [Boletus edulis]
MADRRDKKATALPSRLKETVALPLVSPDSNILPLPYPLQRVLRMLMRRVFYPQSSTIFHLHLTTLNAKPARSQSYRTMGTITISNSRQATISVMVSSLNLEDNNAGKDDSYIDIDAGDKKDWNRGHMEIAFVYLHDARETQAMVVIPDSQKYNIT